MEGQGVVAAVAGEDGAQHAPQQQAIACNGCKQGLEETSDSVVVQFGDGLWHVDWYARVPQIVPIVEGR